MKILYVDTKKTGHHMEYLKALLAAGGDAAVLMPECDIGTACSKVYSLNVKAGNRLKRYFSLLDQVEETAKKEQADIIHFLYGDAFYRFFGLGLKRFRKYKTVITFHWYRSGKLKLFSLKRICARLSKVVVHTDYLCREFLKNGIGNTERVLYPSFLTGDTGAETAKRYWGLKEDVPVIVCAGGTRQDKGLDILLEALKRVREPFQLLIAGREEYFTREYIEKNTAPYRDRCVTVLRYLTDEEMTSAIAAADIIAVPYRKCFNGASGPMTDGAALGKCIVGPDHGNLGYEIRENKLGYTFESESADSLSQTLTVALKNRFTGNESSKSYSSGLSVGAFTDAYARIYHEL